MARLVSIESGGDWNDASYELLEVKPDVDLELEKRRWDDWYRNEYVPNVGSMKYESFDERLVRLGLATKADYETFCDY